MALRDKPQIDPAAANSSRSERKLNDWFNEDTGFILRKEQPDKGCDYMCELLDGTGATNWKFPIQLKSIEQPQIVNNGAFISYPMLTSRLGYMLKQLPTTGIIVLYTVESGDLFYEFSNKIYQQINTHRGSDEWTNQESVNIRIPLHNVLTTTCIKDLHSRLASRFKNAALMQAAHGESYQLPVVKIPGETEFDWNNTDHIRTWLREYGQAMLFRFDLAPVYHSLTRLRIAEIENDKQLLLVACVAYGETGHYFESDLFIKKLRQKFELENEERSMIEFVEAKNQVQLGQLTSPEFIRILEKQVSRATNKQNQLTLRINLQRFKIRDIQGPVDIPLETLSEIQSIYKSIEESEFDQDVKDTLALWNGEHDSHLMTHQQHLDYISFQMLKATGRDLPKGIWMKIVNESINKELKFLKRVEDIYNRAAQKDHKFLQATAQSIMGTYALQKLFSLLSYPDTPKVPEEDMKRFMRYSFMAFRLFREIGHPIEAYRSLCTTLELMHVTQHYYSNVPADYIQALQTDKAALENELMIPSYQLQLPSRLKKIAAIETSKVNDSLAEYPDADLENLARVVFDKLRLPKERFINFHNEIIATRLFQQRCSDPNVQFFCYNFGSTNNAYIQPVQYILKNKLSGIESVRSKSMDDLLSSWGF